MTRDAKELKYLEIYVSDNGKGISTEDKAKLFKLFGKIDQKIRKALDLGCIFANRYAKHLMEILMLIVSWGMDLGSFLHSCLRSLMSL